MFESTEDIRLDLDFIKFLRREGSLLENARQSRLQVTSIIKPYEIYSSERIPVCLLLEVGLASIYDLLHDLDVVLSERTNGLGQDLSIFQDSLPGIAGGVKELASEGVELGNTASLVVEATPNGALSTTLLIEVSNESRLGALANVVDRFWYRHVRIRVLGTTRLTDIPLLSLEKNLIVGKLAISYLVARGRLLWASASTLATIH